MFELMVQCDAAATKTTQGQRCEQLVIKVSKCERCYDAPLKSVKRATARFNQADVPVVRALCIAVSVLWRPLQDAHY